MKRILKKVLKLTLITLVVLVVIGLWLSLVDLSKMWDYFQKLNPLLAILGLTLPLGANFLRGLRWRYLVRGLGEITPGQAMALQMVNQACNSIIPLRSGELAKAIILRRLAAVPISSSLPTIFLDRVFDLLAVVGLVIALPFLVNRLSGSLLWVIIMALVVLALVIGGLLVLRARRDSFMALMEQLTKRLPKALSTKIRKTLDLAMEGFLAVRLSWSDLYWPLGLTVGAFAFDITATYVLFLAFGFSIPLDALIIGSLLLYLTYVLPAPPGQLGSFELSTLVIYNFIFGIDGNLVAAKATFSHIAGSLVIVGGGLIGLSFLGRSLWNELRAVAPTSTGS